MGLIIDLVSDGLVQPGINNQILAATYQGGYQDGSNGEISLNLIVCASVPTIANVTQLNVQAEESTQTASTGTWTIIPSIAGSSMIITVTATTTTTNLLQVVRGLRTQQYYRANAATLSATTVTGAFPVSAVFVSMKRFAQGFGQQSGVDHYPTGN